MRRAMLNEVNLPVDLLVYDDAFFAARSALPTTMEYTIAGNGRLLDPAFVYQSGGPFASAAGRPAPALNFK